VYLEEEEEDCEGVLLGECAEYSIRSVCRYTRDAAGPKARSCELDGYVEG
jgi:hypothetical protein